MIPVRVMSTWVAEAGKMTCDSVFCKCCTYPRASDGYLEPWVVGTPTVQSVLWMRYNGEVCFCVLPTCLRHKSCLHGACALKRSNMQSSKLEASGLHVLRICRKGGDGVRGNPPTASISFLKGLTKEPDSGHSSVVLSVVDSRCWQVTSSVFVKDTERVMVLVIAKKTDGYR